MTDVEQTPPPPQNGFDIGNDDEAGKTRPADIEQDMREMERRKRVDAIMSSKMFREELERIVDSARDGGTHGILQHLSDIVGIPQSRLGNVFKSNNCVVPINDIRGIESIGYTKGEKILRCKLASTFRLLDLFNWSQGDLGAQITARLKVDQEIFLVNPYGLLYNEITASSLNKVDMQGNVVEHGTTNFLVNKNHFSLHSAVHAARPDIRCAIYIGCSPVVAISSLRTGLLPLTKDACVLGEITTFSYTGSLLDADERDRLVRNLGPISKILLLSNHGALCCGETIEEAFFAACRIIQACETQLQLLPVGLDNLVLIPDETRKVIYDQSRRPPDDLAKKFAASASIAEDETDKEVAVNNKEKIVGAAPKWRVGGAEFEALMRMLDNAGFRTGYIYRHPLIKSELPKPKNDVELPPAVSSLGYLLEEEEYFRQGIWKKGDLRKGGDRSKWLNSPNVYQKVEVLETGTPDPKKITKWVAEGSPTHSTPVRIEDPLQFVPVGTTSKEFKRIQQQIKENRRADKISAGPQSHILEGVTWDEANRSLKDGTVTTAGDHVVLMGAASKGIIQRGFQHNAAVYKAPYAKNPFDHVTDDEINEYTRTVERKKKSIHGEYTDTDFSESEPLSSLQTSGGQKQTTTSTTAAVVSHSEPEDAAHQVLRIQTQQVPVRSQAEVVMSDASLDFINGERSHTATNRKPPTGRVSIEHNLLFQEETDANVVQVQEEEIIDNGPIKKGLTVSEQDFKIYHDKIKRNKQLISDMKNAEIFKRQQNKYCENSKDNENSQFMNCENVNVEDGNFNTCASKDNDNLEIDNVSVNINRKLGLRQPLPQPNTNRNYQTMTNYFMTLKRAPAQQGIDCLSNCSASSSPKYGCDSYPPCQRFESYFDIPDNQRYKVASNCLMPRKCKIIFETLQLTAKHEQALWSTASTPCLNTPRNRRERYMTAHQYQYNPYRTISHFGFNSPLQPLEPDHKHIPDDFHVRRYVPIPRSNSYEEIFSSQLYADLCENCFARLLRLKPELLLVRAHLRNLVDIPTTRCTNSHDDGESKDTIDHVEINHYEYVEASQCTVNKDVFPILLTPQLATVVELDENRTSVNVTQNCYLENPCAQELLEEEQEHVIDTSNNTFVGKIMSFNYSEESTNIHFEPPLTESILSIEENRDDEVQPTDNSTMVLPSENRNTSQSPKLNIISIIDMGNWEELDAVKACQYKDPDVKSVENVNLYDRDVDNDEPTCNEWGSIEKASEYSSGHTSMSRLERSRRKLEFQEIWEDHINFHLHKDESEDHVGHDVNAVDFIEEICFPPQHVNNYNSDQDIFLGCSLIVQNDVPTDSATETQNTNPTCEIINRYKNNNTDDQNPQNNKVIISQTTQFFNENENTITYCIVSSTDNNALEFVDLDKNEISHIENECTADLNNNPEDQENISDKDLEILIAKAVDLGISNESKVLECNEDEKLNMNEKSNSSLFYDAQNGDEKSPVSFHTHSNIIEESRHNVVNGVTIQSADIESTSIINTDCNKLKTANISNDVYYDVKSMELTYDNNEDENNFMDISVQTSLCMLNWEDQKGKLSSKCKSNINKISSSTDVDEISLNSMECEILRKIEEHELKVKDTIFQEIDKSIRNKLTPDILLKKIRKKVYETEQVPRDHTCASEFNIDEFINDEEEKPTTSANAKKLLLRKRICTPEDIINDAMSEASAETNTNESEIREVNSKIETDSESEHTQNHITDDCEWNNYSTTTLSSDDIQEKNKLPKNGKFCTAKEFNIALTNGRLKRDWTPPQNTNSAPEFRYHKNPKGSEQENEVTRTGRDFIRENIMRAGVSCRGKSHRKITPNRGNMSSIFGKNPFGPVLSNPNEQKYPSKKLKQKIENMKGETTNKVHVQSSSTSSNFANLQENSSVYSFETQKHQRFWMSLSPTDKRKLSKKTRNFSKTLSCEKSTTTEGCVSKTSTPYSLRRKLFADIQTDDESHDNRPCSPRHSLFGKRKMKDGKSAVMYKQPRVQETSDEQSDTNDSDDNRECESEVNMTFIAKQIDSADSTNDD